MTGKAGRVCTGLKAALLASMLGMTGGLASPANAEIDGTRAAIAGLKVLQAFTLSEKKVKRAASLSAQEQDRKHRLAPADSAYVRRLANLTRGLPEAVGIPLDIRVYLAKDINAFAMADGTVRVYSGLMDAMPDDQVLAVIGHEIGHVQLRHSYNQMREALLTDSAFTALASAGGKLGELSGGQLGALAQAAINARFSRGDEIEADQFSVAVLNALGQDPFAMKRAIETLQAKVGEAGGFLSSHPANEVRIANIIHAIQRLPTLPR
jgi:putative metalloprotease